jgi:hypothetical protein
MSSFGGAINLKKSEDEDLQAFIFEFQRTGVKLAGALTGIAKAEALRIRHSPSRV